LVPKVVANPCLIPAGGEVWRFRDPSRRFLRPEDGKIALDIDRCDFPVRVEFRERATDRARGKASVTLKAEALRGHPHTADRAIQKCLEKSPLASAG
jgi:hypothetical protein